MDGSGTAASTSNRLSTMPADRELTVNPSGTSKTGPPIGKRSVLPKEAFAFALPCVMFVEAPAMTVIATVMLNGEPTTMSNSGVPKMSPPASRPVEPKTSSLRLLLE